MNKLSTGDYSVADGVRYRRLRLLGCAPEGSRQHKAGTVLRFQALDDFVDLDIAAHPERGDGPFDVDESPAEQALREIASFLGIGGHNAPLVDVATYKSKILEVIAAISTDQPDVREQQAQAGGVPEHLREGLQHAVSKVGDWLRGGCMTETPRTLVALLREFANSELSTPVIPAGSEEFGEPVGQSQAAQAWWKQKCAHCSRPLDEPDFCEVCDGEPDLTPAPQAREPAHQVVAWLDKKSLDELQHCNGVSIWAESPQLYAPHDVMGAQAPDSLVAVSLTPAPQAREPAEPVAWMMRWTGHAPSVTTDPSDYPTERDQGLLIPLYAAPSQAEPAQPHPCSLSATGDSNG